MPEAMHGKFAAGAAEAGMDVLDPIATVGRELAEAGGMSPENAQALELMLGAANPLPGAEMKAPLLMGTVIGGSKRQRQIFAEAVKAIKRATDPTSPARKTLLRHMNEMFLSRRPKGTKVSGTFNPLRSTAAMERELRAEADILRTKADQAFGQGKQDIAFGRLTHLPELERQIDRLENFKKRGKFQGKYLPETAIKQKVAPEKELRTALHEGLHASDPQNRAAVDEMLKFKLDVPILRAEDSPLYGPLTRSDLEKVAGKRGKSPEWIKDPREKFAYGLEEEAFGRPTLSSEAKEAIGRYAGIDPEALRIKNPFD
jgi:hypothetical protein